MHLMPPAQPRGPHTSHGADPWEVLDAGPLKPLLVTILHHQDHRQKPLPQLPFLSVCGLSPHLAPSPAASITGLGRGLSKKECTPRSRLGWSRKTLSLALLLEAGRSLPPFTKWAQPGLPTRCLWSRVGCFGFGDPRRDTCPSRMKVFLTALLAALLGAEQGEVP